MVFFTCNACGQAVKKNQVEKHYLTQCRNCTALSCIDCGKEFVGDEYQSHVKCITEDEKYGGKGFQPKPSSGKGEAKQANWIANIKKYVEETDIPGNLANLLKTIINYSNVPRKKQKFQNFLRCSAHVKDQRLADQAWDVFMKANQQDEPIKIEKKGTETPQKSEVKQDDDNSKQVHTDETSIKKSKKKEKIEGDKTIGELQNGNEAEKGDEGSKENIECEGHLELEQVKKSKKKRKHDKTLTETEFIMDSSSTHDSHCNGDSLAKKVKKKRKHDMDSSNAEDDKTVIETGKLITDSSSTHDSHCNGDSSAKKAKKWRKHDVDSISSNAEDDNVKSKEVSDNEIQGHSLTDSANKRKKKKKKRDKCQDNFEADLSHEVESRQNDKPIKKKKKKCVEDKVE